MFAKITIIQSKYAAIVSKYFGEGILCLTALFYASQFIRESITNVFPIGLSAFGILGVLSATCFTLVPCLDKEDDKPQALYAGEKFLHSCLLIIQSIFVKYASEQIVSLQFVKNVPWLLSTINIITILILVTVISYATYFSLFGFEALNDFLWNRYEKRLKKLTSKKK
jgi:hypothetical protein